MDKITLTKKQFSNVWNKPSESMLGEDIAWQSLVAESQKPELIERWAVMISNGTWDYSFITLEDAEKYMKNNYPTTARIVHLREVVANENP
jgi:hypothetical protein